jgi:hypothetical protein
MTSGKSSLNPKPHKIPPKNNKLKFQNSFQKTLSFINKKIKTRKKKKIEQIVN